MQQSPRKYLSICGAGRNCSENLKKCSPPSPAVPWLVNGHGTLNQAFWLKLWLKGDLLPFSPTHFYQCHYYCFPLNSMFYQLCFDLFVCWFRAQGFQNWRPSIVNRRHSILNNVDSWWLIKMGLSKFLMIYLSLVMILRTFLIFWKFWAWWFV